MLLGAAPEAPAQQAPPYRPHLFKDGATITGLTALSVMGLYLVQQKSGLNAAELAALNKKPAAEQAAVKGVGTAALLLVILLFVIR